MKRVSASSLDKIILQDFLYQKNFSLDFSGKCTKYDLVAIITHHGSVGGGHYVAYCKNFVTGKWYEFNDSYVTEGTIDITRYLII